MSPPSSLTDEALEAMFPPPAEPPFEGPTPEATTLGWQLMAEFHRRTFQAARSIAERDGRTESTAEDVRAAVAVAAQRIAQDHAHAAPHARTTATVAA